MEPQKQIKNKPNIKIIAVVSATAFFVAAIIAGIICAVAMEGRVYYWAGGEITLSKKFEEKQIEGTYAAFASEDQFVFVMKESVPISPSNRLSCEEYADKLIRDMALGNDVVPVTDDKGIVHFEYEMPNASDGITYSYYTCIYKTTSSYWIVQFSTDKALYEDCKDDFEMYSRTVMFT